MLRIAVFCSTRARWVVLAWLLVAVAGAVVTVGISSRPEHVVHPAGESGYEANRAILGAVGSGGPQTPR